MSPRYPALICDACGMAHGRGKASRWSTWSLGVCGWCHASTSVTQPRDYGDPPAPAACGGGRTAPPLTDLDAPAIPTADVSAPQGRPSKPALAAAKPESTSP